MNVSNEPRRWDGGNDSTLISKPWIKNCLDSLPDGSSKQVTSSTDNNRVNTVLPCSVNQNIGSTVIDQITKKNPYEKKNWTTIIIKSPILYSVMTSIIVIVILLIVNPQFVRKKTDNPIQKGSIDPIKILSWGIGCGLLVLIVPFAYTKLKSKEQ